MTKRLPHLQKTCNDCPFRKDSLPGWLGRERIIEILESDSFVCHKKTDYQCAGFMHIQEFSSAYVRYAYALSLDLGLKGRELVFSTVEECIKHHSNQV